MIEKFLPSTKPKDSTSKSEVLVKTKTTEPYLGGYFTGYYSYRGGTWKIYTVKSNSPTRGIYIPISEECIEHWIPLENDYIKE